MIHYSFFDDLYPVALKYYVIKLRTTVHTFGNDVKITSFRYEFMSYTALSVSFLLWCVVCI